MTWWIVLCSVVAFFAFGVGFLIAWCMRSNLARLEDRQRGIGFDDSGWLED